MAFRALPVTSGSGSVSSHPGHGSHTHILGVYCHPLLRAQLRRHVVHPRHARFLEPFGRLAVTDPAAGTLPERCAMGTDSLRGADDRALLRRGSVLHGHRLPGQKAIEVALIALLLAEARTASSEPSRIASGTPTTRL
jgi:hypothetical protein